MMMRTTTIRGESHLPCRHDIDSIVERIWMSVTTTTDHSFRIECNVEMIVSRHLVVWKKKKKVVVVTMIVVVVVVVVVVRDASY